MRDIALFIVVFASIPFAFKRPMVGAIMFAWISLMNPHRLCFGSAFDFPFAALMTGVMLLCVLVTKQKQKLPMTPITVTLLALLGWMTFTTLFALEPELAWTEWNRVSKTFAMVFVTMMLLRTELDIKALAWTIALSLGYFGLKGGLFTVRTGGAGRVFGPEYTYITDNNCLALALVTALPMIWFVFLNARHGIVRLGFAVIAFFTLAAAAGSYSRGAMLSGAAMLTFLWIKSRRKLQTLLIFALAIPVVYNVLPDEWFERMNSIDNYQEDGSAVGRINAWRFAFNLATHNPLGGGFATFTKRLFQIYAPVPTDHHAAHSIYFQVLGEHGFVGLALFLLLLVLAWRTGSRIIKTAKADPDLKWMQDLASMCQVSLIGYATGGAFLTLAYYDLYYYILALLVLMENFLLKRTASLASPQGLNPAPARGVPTRQPS